MDISAVSQKIYLIEILTNSTNSKEKTAMTASILRSFPLSNGG